jgi:hypothetical protein
MGEPLLTIGCSAAVRSFVVHHAACPEGAVSHTVYVSVNLISAFLSVRSQLADRRMGSIATLSENSSSSVRMKMF